MNDISQLTLILIASLFATIVSRRLAIPAVVGQMLVGLLLAPSALGLIRGGHTVEVLAEIGVILLMFLAGLEANIGALRKNLKTSMLVALTGVLVPLGVFWLTAFLMGADPLTSVFYGIVFSATSVSITVEVLQEYGKLSTQAGSIILGAAVIDDILAVLALSIFTSARSSGGDLLLKAALTLLFVGFLILVHRSVPRLWTFVEKLSVYAKNTTVSVILCLGLALLANAVGLSAVVGAFFAGLAISQTAPSAKIMEYTSAIAYVVFIPVFFVSIALSVKLDSLLKNPLIILLLTLLAVATKFLPAYLSSRASKLSPSASTLVGTGMISRGEMALVVVQIGLGSALISETAYSELVIVIMLTTLIAPFLIKWSLK